MKAPGNYFGSFDHAIYLAAVYHAGQVDKAGQPYLLHIVQVVASCPDGDAKIVAALHDIVEDTGMTLEDLASLDFAPHIIQAVDALSRRPGERYLGEYILRVASNELARQVKCKDLIHNLVAKRQAWPDGDQEKYARLMDRYHKAYRYLID